MNLSKWIAENVNYKRVTRNQGYQCNLITRDWGFYQVNMWNTEFERINNEQDYYLEPNCKRLMLKEGRLNIRRDGEYIK